MEVNRHTVPPTATRARLSDYLVGIFPELPSRKSTKKAIDRGLVHVNGAPAETGLWIETGMLIALHDDDRPLPRVFPVEIPVVYEDEHLALLNKPGGIPVSGNQYRTIENALPHNLSLSSLPDALKRIRPVHRLDGPTCGLLLVAKTKTCRMLLGQQFEAKQVEKTYHAVVIGVPPANGLLNSPIGEKSAETHFEVIESVRSNRSGWLSLVKLVPVTGRTHQLRVHLSEAGFPILGDKEYCPADLLLQGKGLFLCSTSLSFFHPATHERVLFELDLPHKFRHFMLGEQRRWEKYRVGE